MPAKLIPPLCHLRFCAAILLLSFACIRSNAQAGKGVSSVAYHPSGATLAVGGYQVVSILDAGTGKELLKLGGHAGNVTSVQFSSDGKWLAAGGGLPGKAGEVKLWDVAWIKTHSVIKDKPAPITLTGPSDAVYSVSFSPDGKQLAAASYDHDITVWSLGTAGSRSRPRVLKDHTDAVYAVAFSPDGRFIASGAGDRTVKIWSAQTGKRLYTLSESTAEVFTLAFRPDSKQIAAGGADKQLRVWNINATEGKLVKSAFAHNGAILRVAYSQDGQSILTSGEDDAVKRWSAADILEQKVYPKLPDWPQGIALSPNGKTLAIGCHNGLLAIYDAATGKLIREPMKGMPVLAKTDQSAMPKSSEIPGRRLGDNKQRGPLNTGGITLRAASLGDLAPKGAPRGGTVRFTLFGGLISDANGVYFDDPAITGKIVTPADPNSGILRVDVMLGERARLGIHRVFVQSPHGTTGGVTFAVGGWPEVAQVEPNNTLETAQKIAYPCTVVGALDTPGDIDCYKVEAKAGEELVFEVVAQPIRSRLQPVLTLVNAEGKTLAVSQTRIGRSDTLLGYRFTENGTYIVQLRDFESAGGGDVHYRLNVGEFPVVTDVFPLGGQAGNPVDVDVTGFNLGVTTTKLNLPANSGWGSATGVSPTTPKGAMYVTRPIQVGMDKEVRQAAGNETLASAQRIDVPVAVNGRLAASGTHEGVNHYYRFSAKKGQLLSLDVVARRFGSPLDSEIEILDSAGKPIERAVVRPVYQTEVTLNDRDSATNALRIFAWDGVGINDYMMIGREVVKVGEMPRGPDSDIFFRTYRGQRLTYFGTTPEYHSVGQQMYKVEVHPAGTRFSPNGYPVTRLTYRNDDGGMLYGKDSHLDFTAPEDGEYIVRIADTRGLSGPEYAYRLLIHPPRPDYKIVMSPDHPNMPKGGGTVINVECERYDGFDGAIDLKLEGLPAGFTATSTSIEAGETSASILVSASKDAVTPTDAASKSSMRVVGTAKIDGKDVRHEIGPDAGVRLLTVMSAPDVVVTTAQKELVIHPGEEITLEVAAERQGMFGGRIPLEVKNLPFGVQVQNIGLNGILIPEQETSRTIAIRCEPWVKPQTRSFYVLASVEGGVSNTAAPVTIRVEPSSSRSANGRTIRSASTSTRK